MKMGMRTSAVSILLAYAFVCVRARPMSVRPVPPRPRSSIFNEEVDTPTKRFSGVNVGHPGAEPKVQEISTGDSELPAKIEMLRPSAADLSNLDAHGAVEQAVAQQTVQLVEQPATDHWWSSAAAAAGMVIPKGIPISFAMAGKCSATLVDPPEHATILAALISDFLD